MEIVLGVLALLVVTGVVAAFIASRPRRGSDLDPPPASPRLSKGKAKSESPPAPPKKRRKIPSEEELNRQAAELVAEAEAVLAATQAPPKPPDAPEAPPPRPRRPRSR